MFNILVYLLNIRESSFENVKANYLEHSTRSPQKNLDIIMN